MLDQLARASGSVLPLLKRAHDVTYFAARVDEEISRYDYYGQPFALIALTAPPGDDGSAWYREQAVRVVRAIVALKRPHDVLSWICTQTLVLLLPHTAVGEAVRERDKLASQLRGIATAWTISALAYPADASAFDQLPLES
jgi:hypothetical protein